MYAVDVFEISIVLFIKTSILRYVVSASSSEYPLHECIFDGSLTELTTLLKSDDVRIDDKDKHGNTALHLAVMMGKKEFIDLLLERDAPVNTNNLSGWSPLSEAISYGDREIIRKLYLKDKQQNEDRMIEKQPHLLTALKNIEDFYLELKWSFNSWLPLILVTLPSDLWKIRKRGSSVRFDSKMVFEGSSGKKGDVSYLFDSEAPIKESLIYLDNERHVYGKSGYKETELEIEKEIDKLMKNEITYMELNTKSAKSSRVRTGFIFGTKDKTEMVGSYEANYYVVDGLILETRKRREHLSAKYIQRSERFEEALNMGEWPKTDSQSGDSQSAEQVSRERQIQSTRHKRSLQPPPANSVSWRTYINSEPGKHPNIGRPVMLKESKKNYKTTVAMSEQFPLSVEMLMQVLEALGTIQPTQMTSLKEFLQMKLPPGFPVKLDIPVFLTVKANIIFQKFEVVQNASEADFKIPTNYQPVRLEEVTRMCTFGHVNFRLNTNANSVQLKQATALPDITDYAPLSAQTIKTASVPLSPNQWQNNYLILLFLKDPGLGSPLSDTLGQKEAIFLIASKKNSLPYLIYLFTCLLFP